jgi:V/A-type H+-transporting ATPase subunit D
VLVRLRWTSVVGVTVPRDPRPVGPAPAPPEVPANTAVVAAAAAFEAALRAGAELAVVEEAARRVESEIALTRRRVRALEKHWLPALRAALAAVGQALELDEQEDDGRLRRALDGTGVRASPGLRTGADRPLSPTVAGTSVKRRDETRRTR